LAVHRTGLPAAHCQETLDWDCAAGPVRLAPGAGVRSCFGVHCPL